MGGFKKSPHRKDLKSGQYVWLIYLEQRVVASSFLRRMMLIQPTILALGFSMAFGMQTIPTNVKIYKSDEGNCQVTIPSDWITNEFMAADAKKVISLSVFYEQDAEVEKLSESALKQIHGATIIFENTAQRRFVESPVPAFGPNPPGRKWESLVPAKPKGACQVIVSLKEGASLNTARSIVMSLKQEIPGIGNIPNQKSTDQILRQYSVQIDLGSGDGTQIDAGFRESIGLNAAELQESSSKSRSGNQRATRITLKQGVFRRQVLERWLAQMHTGGSEDQCTIIVRMMNADRTQVLQTYRLLNASIVNYSGSELEATGEEVSIESLELSYEKLEP